MRHLLKSLSLLFVGSHICRGYRSPCAAIKPCPISRVSSAFTNYISRSLHHVEVATFNLVARPFTKSSSTLTSVGKIVEGWVVQCRSLWLLYGNPETALAVECALRKLDNHPYHSRQHAVIHGPKSVDHDEYAFRLRTFTPLMRFSHLKEVLLSSFCMSWLDDDALSTIVKSWPRLERLDLGTAHFWQTQPSITFRGLVTLLSSCPNLENLGLVFDATNVGPPSTGRLGGVCNTKITKFSVGCSPIEQLPQVALALSQILPCLRNIEVEPWA
ncbi:hypothetical protein EV702DRAFT_1036356 [Suillus placidus]|uniref:Uncharacterized protein n=1 Tax=Suillus placidus TaxID=48579 RepID=A0A9P6ZHU8_9AGAM|nr:hypothetical protein EV702DRAFT_1036356 [Suillus placidus]